MLDPVRVRGFLDIFGAWDPTLAFVMGGAIAVGFFAFVSKQFPDLTVFAGSPAVVALDMAQRSLPALQLTELTDPHPLPQPVLVPPYAGPRMPGPAPATGRERVPLAVASLATAGAGFAVLRRRR